MKRRRHWLLDTLTIVSLLLLAATILLWVRSHRPHISVSDADCFDITRTEPLYWVISNRDRLTLCRQAGRDWQSPATQFNVLGLEYASSWVGDSSLWNLLVPFWMLAIAFILLPLIRIAWWMRHSRRVDAKFCQTCLYDLTGNVSGICPECGRPITPAVPDARRWA